MSKQVAWWPPRVGAKLRHATMHSARGTGRETRVRIKRVEALLRVLAVFRHDGAVRIVTAEWFPTKRCWHYEIRSEADAIVGSIWPDGQIRPMEQP